MKTLLILSVIIGYTLPEKLNRTYLPPPGSNFSEEVPGDIEVQLAFPKKDTHAISSEDNNFGRPEIVIGIDRIGSNISPETHGEISSTVPPFRENSHNFPTTSTSYAFSQTTSYIPAAGYTFGPEMLFNLKYPFNNSINNLNPDYGRPTNIYNVGEEKQILKVPNNIPENPIRYSDNRINSQVVNNISDVSVHSYNGDVNSVPEINSYSGDLAISGITSSTINIDHTFLNNNYETYHSPTPLEPINKQGLNLISTTSLPSDNVYSKTPPTPYLYRTFPERIRAQDDRQAVVLNYDNTITPNGYSYSFDTSNGIHADEKGIIINGVQALGSYSYIGDDGQLYSVSYTADEKGFRPYGAHLPTAPPIPDAILKVIEQAAIDKANGIYDDGSYDENKYGYQKYNPTTNISFLNQNGRHREGTNLNKNKSNNELPQHSRLGENENHNKGNDINKNNEHNITTTLKLEPFMTNELYNESVSENTPNYNLNHLENIGKDHNEDSSNDNNYKLQNNILDSMSHLKDKGKEDKINSTELYYETGYRYSKPHNDNSLKAADKFINRFSEIPISNKIPAGNNKIVENIPARPFMTPYVSRNDDIFVKQDSDDQYLDIPAKKHVEENVILGNQNVNPFQTLVDTEMVPEKTRNKIVHNLVNQVKQPDISPSDDQGYLYIKKVNSNNDGYLPFITSTEIGFSDITSTTPTVFPSRFHTLESSKDKNSRKPLNQPESKLFQNPVTLPNRSLNQEKHLGPLAHSNNYGSYNDDITGSGPTNNMSNIDEADKDYPVIHSTSKTYNGEDFSGPKQSQKYDPLTGYHY